MRLWQRLGPLTFWLFKWLLIDKINVKSASGCQKYSQTLGLLVMSKPRGRMCQIFVPLSEFINFTPLQFKISTFVYKVRWFQVATYNFMAIQDFYYHFMQQSNWKWCGIFLVSSNFLALFRFSKENVNRCILDIAF